MWPTKSLKECCNFGKEETIPNTGYCWKCHWMQDHSLPTHLPSSPSCPQWLSSHSPSQHLVVYPTSWGSQFYREWLYLLLKHTLNLYSSLCLYCLSPGLSYGLGDHCPSPLTGLPISSFMPNSLVRLSFWNTQPLSTAVVPDHSLPWCVREVPLREHTLPVGAPGLSIPSPPPYLGKHHRLDVKDRDIARITLTKF